MRLGRAWSAVTVSAIRPFMTLQGFFRDQDSAAVAASRSRLALRADGLRSLLHGDGSTRKIEIAGRRKFLPTRAGAP